MKASHRLAFQMRWRNLPSIKHAQPIQRLSSSAAGSRTQPGQRPITYMAIGVLIGGLFTASMRGFGNSPASVNEPIPRWKTPETHHRPSARTKYADITTTMKAVGEIRERLGEDGVSVDKDDLEDHGFSEWSTSNTEVRPIAIVHPKTTEDVSAIAKICTHYKVPMVPYGAGSSVEGNFSSPYAGICVDVSSMDKIVAFHPEDMDVVVQPGVNWVNLNDKIKDTGLFLPLDPSPTALIGGMVATNCSGTNAMRYGTMKDYVVNLTVVLADGSVIKTRHRPRKTSAGYNLTALFTGSEGTLGIITEVTLKLAIVPESFSVATATFSTVKDAADAAFKMMRRGVPLAALELMDDVQMKVINLSGGAGGRIWDEAPTLFLKFSGSEKTVEDSTRLAQEIVQSNGCHSFVSATTEEQMQSLWSARKQALWASLAARPEGTQIWSTDVAVPLSRMAELIGTQMHMNFSVWTNTCQRYPRRELAI
ncbi:D-lactate dehydrogenase (cytochrome) [Ilyonectria robusta]